MGTSIPTEISNFFGEKSDTRKTGISSSSYERKTKHCHYKIILPWIKAQPALDKKRQQVFACV